jgi:hypothetical protein
MEEAPGDLGGGDASFFLSFRKEFRSSPLTIFFFGPSFFLSSGSLSHFSLKKKGKMADRRLQLHTRPKQTVNLFYSSMSGVQPPSIVFKF